MTRFRNNVVLTLACLCTLGMVTACKTVTSGDPLVVRAEQAQKICTYTLDTLMKFEYDNRVVLWNTNPNIKKFVDMCRESEQKWILGLDKATKAYKMGRTVENRADLATWLAVVESVVTDVQSALVEARKAVVK